MNQQQIIDSINVVLKSLGLAQALGYGETEKIAIKKLNELLQQL